MLRTTLRLMVWSSLPVNHAPPRPTYQTQRNISQTQHKTRWLLNNAQNTNFYAENNLLV